MKIEKEEMISIIVPVYNVEKYLDRCLESIINQTYRNLEIILVDDGSLDTCPEKCDNWAKKDNRIKVIHKKNAGLGMARNTGIENASGKYLYFCDSDDYIDLETLSKIYKSAKDNDADIVTFGINHVLSNGKIEKVEIPNYIKKVYKNEEVIEELLPNLISYDPVNKINYNLFMSANTSLYSMKMIKESNWKFVSEREIISEDIYSLLDLYSHVKTAVILPETLYFYCENMASLTHVYRCDRYEKLKYFYDMCIKKSNELQYNEEIKSRLMYPYIANTIAALKMIVTSNCKFNDKRKEFKKIITDNHFQKIIRKLNISNEKISRKILFIILRKKYFNISYLLLMVKSKKSK